MINRGDLQGEDGFSKRLPSMNTGTTSLGRFNAEPGGLKREKREKKTREKTA